MPTSKVLIIDTSILCVWLQVAGMETCGKTGDLWDFEKVNAKIQEELEQNTTFVLPLATIIETGNHISQCNGDRFKLAKSLGDIIKKVAEEETPWAAFSNQSPLWEPEQLIDLATNWPAEAAREISIGDFTISKVADFYANIGHQVEIFTGDEGLKVYETAINFKPLPPRRRK